MEYNILQLKLVILTKTEAKNVVAEFYHPSIILKYLFLPSEQLTNSSLPSPSLCYNCTSKIIYTSWQMHLILSFYFQSLFLYLHVIFIIHPQ